MKKKKIIVMLMLCLSTLMLMLTLQITAFGTTINTTQQLKGYFEISLKSGVKQVRFSSKLTLKQIDGTLKLIDGEGYAYSYVKRYTFIKTGSSVTVQFLSGYSQTAIKKMNTDLDKEVLRIVRNVVKTGMTAYQKELALHDYLVRCARYDTRVYSGKAPAVSFTAYGALIKKAAVCEGYAKALSLLFKKAGIPSVYVTGSGSGQPHAWNLVKLDGEYYHVDATFDDPVTATGQQLLSHDFFNRTDAQMRVTHAWASKFPKAVGTKYAYKYETEIADASLIKSVDELTAALEKAVLERQTTLSVKVFRFRQDVYDLTAMVDAVMTNHAELDYIAFCSGYSSSTIGEITTLKVALDYVDNFQ